MSDLARAEAVRDVVTRVAHTIDFRRWSDLRALYADQVSIDYTSLFGGEVQQQRADDLIEGWRRLLSPLDATQHLLGPIDVQLQGGTAIAECHVRGYHVMCGAAGGGRRTAERSANSSSLRVGRPSPFVHHPRDFSRDPMSRTGSELRHTSKRGRTSRI